MGRQSGSGQQLKLEDLAKLKEILNEKRRLAHNRAIRKAARIAGDSWSVGTEFRIQAEATERAILELLWSKPKSRKMKS